MNTKLRLADGVQDMIFVPYNETTKEGAWVPADTFVAAYNKLNPFVVKMAENGQMLGTFFGDIWGQIKETSHDFIGMVTGKGGVNPYIQQPDGGGTAYYPPTPQQPQIIYMQNPTPPAATVTASGIDFTKLIMIGGIGIGAYFLLKKKKMI